MGPSNVNLGAEVPTANARFFLPTLLLLLGLSSSVAYSNEPELPVLRPEPVELEIPEVRGPQYLGADAKGRLVLVRGNRPEFHEILADGRVRPWGNAEDRQAVLDATVPGVLAASRSLDGRWLLAGPNQMLVVSRNEAKTLPKLPLETLSVAFLNHPVAGVLPTIHGRVIPRYFDPETPPLLVELTSSGWRPLREEPFSAAEKAAPESVHTHRAYRALHLAPAANGGLWAAHHYLYRLRRFSESGSEEIDLTLQASPELRELEDEAVEELRGRLAERAALLGQDGAKVQPFTTKPVIEAISEGRDGKVYLYIPPGVFGNVPLLDRYDPTTHRIERAELAVDHPGRVTLASGRDGLWIAALGSSRSLWRIPWLELAELSWQPVPGLHLDGAPVDP